MSSSPPTTLQCGATNPGSPGDCSYTDVGGSIGITLSGSALLGPTHPVGRQRHHSNAVGQTGLDVSGPRNLRHQPAGSWWAPLAVNAGTTLPSTWTSGVALINNAPVSLAFSISETSLCLAASPSAKRIQERRTSTSQMPGPITASQCTRDCTAAAAGSCRLELHEDSPAAYSLRIRWQRLGRCHDHRR